MSITYEPTSFDFDKKRIYFLLKDGKYKHTTYITFNRRRDISMYEEVNKECHFRDINGDIVVIKGCTTKLVSIINGETFIKARQWEYDRWMSRKYPNTINAVVYARLSHLNFKTSTV